MAADVEIDRALATVSATLNDQKLEQFDADRVEEIVTDALGGEQKLTVDDGGGLHDEAGVRIAAIRRTDSGEWIAERQNTAAENSDHAIPTAPPQSKLRKLMTRLHVMKP
jgi:hypothetical protein